MTTTTVVTQQPPSIPPNREAQGYVDTMSLRSGQYKVFAFIENSDGSRVYLSDSCDRQVREKIRTLSWGLLNAHDKKSQSLGESHFEIKGIDSRGAIKRDNTVATHDFAIQPVSQLIADQMATTLTNSGRPIQSSAIKAQDVWNALEDVVRTGISPANPSSPARIDTSLSPTNPVSPGTPPGSTTTPPSPLSSTPSTSNPAPNPLTNPSSTPAPDPNLLSEANPITTAPLDPIIPPVTPLAPSLPPTSIDLDLRGVNFQQPNWYENLPLRLKYRIVKEVEEGRSPLGGVYHEVWKHFEAKTQQILRDHPSSKVTIFTLMESEKKHLAKECGRLTPASLIPRDMRRDAEKVYNAYMNRRPDSEVKDSLNALMRRDFDRKEELFQRIRQQAEAESLAIEAWDIDWAKNHYADDSRRFVQALARWLDNDG